MLLNCFTSCTRRLTPRRVESTADTGESAPLVPDPVPEQVAPEAAPGSPQLPAAIDANGPEPPFQTDLCFCTITGKVEVLPVTVDESMSVNVVTNKCLARLGFKPLQDAMPPELSELTSQAFPGHYGWQKLGLFAPSGHRGLSSDVDFLVVGDDYHCDLLLGCEFKRLTLKPRPGIYPNHLIQPGNGPHINGFPPFFWAALARTVKHRMLTIVFFADDRERQERERQERQAREAQRAAARKEEREKRLEQLRKEDPKSGGGAGEGTSA